jgi:hypothetical protein
MTRIHEQFALSSHVVITFTGCALRAWGRTLIFEGTAGEIRFTLTFSDCREMRWRMYVHLDADQPTTLHDFAAGRDQHRSPAQLLTDHFGVSLFYGTMTLTPGDQPTSSSSSGTT